VLTCYPWLAAVAAAEPYLINTAQAAVVLVDLSTPQV